MVDISSYSSDKSTFPEVTCSQIRFKIVFTNLQHLLEEGNKNRYRIDR